MSQLHQFGQDLVQGCFWHHSNGSLRFTLGVNEHPCRLAGNAEVGVKRIIEIGQVGECELVFLHETLERLVVTLPRNSDDGYFASELLCDHLDRGGFGIARASSGGPEPERRWLSGELGTVDGATAHLVGLEGVDLRNSNCRLRGRRRCSGNGLTRPATGEGQKYTATQRRSATNIHNQECRSQPGIGVGRGKEFRNCLADGGRNIQI